VPVNLLSFEGDSYLVSARGEGQWVRNVRAADGRAVLVRAHREAVHLDPVDTGERGAILRRYLACAPGARSHIDIAPTAPVEEFDRLAQNYPIFRVNVLADVRA